MKRSIFILCSLFMASPGVAQVSSLSNYAQLGPYYANTPGRASSSAADEPICMRQIRTGERVCRSRFEWRQIAARLTRGENWR